MQLVVSSHNTATVHWQIKLKVGLTRETHLWFI